MTNNVKWLNDKLSSKMFYKIHSLFSKHLLFCFLVSSSKRSRKKTMITCPLKVTSIKGHARRDFLFYISRKKISGFSIFVWLNYPIAFNRCLNGYLLPYETKWDNEYRIFSPLALLLTGNFPARNHESQKNRDVKRARLVS